MSGWAPAPQADPLHRLGRKPNQHTTKRALTWTPVRPATCTNPAMRSTLDPEATLRASAEDTDVTREGGRSHLSLPSAHPRLRLPESCLRSGHQHWELGNAPQGVGPTPTGSYPHKGPETNRCPHCMVESSPRLLSWFHPFTFKRFHVLLNSLFKVLCNFPSRYLFAIGFTEIFSLSSSLRAALGCTLKQPDSVMPRLARVPGHRYGPTTHSG